MNGRQRVFAALALLGLLTLLSGPSDSVQAVERAPVCAPAVPLEPAALNRWLERACYHSWTAESAVHAATLGPGGVRVFLNPVLATSLRARQLQHPMGSGAVREIYESDHKTLRGYSVLLKTGGESETGWYFFETFLRAQNQPAVSQHDAPGCLSCHRQGVDLIRSEWPLP